MIKSATKTAIQTLAPGRLWVVADKDKLPYTPTTGKLAKSNNANTWQTYEQAHAALKRHPDKYLAIGRMFTRESTITVIDLDHCVDEQGNISPWASDLLQRFSSYAEYSPSGHGIHLWISGNIPANIPADIEADGERRIEMYDHGRYFTWTGKQLPGTPDSIEDCQTALTTLYGEVKARRDVFKAEKRKQQSPRAPQSKVTQGLPNSSDTPYGLAALQRECDQLARTREGARNQQLNNSAFALGQLIAGGELSQSTVEHEVKAAALQAGLDEREIDGTLGSAIPAGMREPRSAPHDTIALPQTSNQGDGGNHSSNSATTAGARRPFNFTDLGNAERFAARYHDRVRWSEVWNTWLVFTGKYWDTDKAGQVDQLAKATVRAIYQEAAAEPDDGKRKAIVKHAVASESNRAVRALLDRAKSELPAVPSEFNTHLHLINCQNGTLDLRTGQLRAHNPKDLLTRCVTVNYNPQASCDQWRAFIHTIFDGNRDLITFLQQALGMSLSGDISEQCLFICHGGGSNGKTTLLECVRIILGAYGMAANIETFQTRKNDSARYDVVELYGARFVTASENTIGSRLNEAFVKKATGKEPLRGARKYEGEFEFMPECTLWLAVNHKPVVKDTTKGMWRRVHFIPFSVTIDDQHIDKHLGDKLAAEAEGIFAWLVQGCISWYQQGRLNVPAIVRNATQVYKAEMDTVANFLQSECVLGKEYDAGTKHLQERYEWWCGQNGEVYKAAELKKGLNERGLHSTRTGVGYVYHGIGLLSTENDPTGLERSDSDEGNEGNERNEHEFQDSSRGVEARQKTLNSCSLRSLPSLDFESEQYQTQAEYLGKNGIVRPSRGCEGDHGDSGWWPVVRDGGRVAKWECVYCHPEILPEVQS